MHDLPPQGLLVYEIFCVKIIQYTPIKHKKKSPISLTSTKNFFQLMLKKPLCYRALLEGGLERSGRTKVDASILAVNVQSSCAGINDVTYSCINLCVCVFACSLLKHSHTRKHCTHTLHPKIKLITSWTSRCLTSSFSLGVSRLFCRATQCMRGM